MVVAFHEAMLLASTDIRNSRMVEIVASRILYFGAANQMRDKERVMHSWVALTACTPIASSGQSTYKA